MCTRNEKLCTQQEKKDEKWVWQPIFRAFSLENDRETRLVRLQNPINRLWLLKGLDQSVLHGISSIDRDSNSFKDRNYN